MRIAAFDVSLLRTGVCRLNDGQLVDSGTIQPDITTPRPRQLGHIFSMTRRWFSCADIVAIETSKGFQRMTNNSRESIDALAMARAAIMLALERETAGIKLVEMDPRRVRELVCGNPNASKEQVQAALTARGHVLPTMEKRVREGGHYVVKTVVDPDIADAIGLACAVWAEESWRRKVEQAQAELHDALAGRPRIELTIEGEDE